MAQASPSAPAGASVEEVRVAALLAASQPHVPDAKLLAENIATQGNFPSLDAAQQSHFKATDVYFAELGR